MDILLFFAEGNNRIIDELYRLSESCGFRLILQEISGIWKDENALMNKLNESRYVFVVFKKEYLKADWFFFLTGFCLGKKNGLVLYNKEKTDLPGYLSFAVQAGTMGSVRSQLEIWKEQSGMEKARQDIHNMGLYMTPFHFIRSVIKDQQESVKVFLKAGFSPDTKDDSNVPVLCLAVREGLDDMARILIEAGSDVNAVAPDRNYNALMEAAALGNAEMVRFLIAKGSKLNVQSKNDQTALMLAVGIGNDEVVKLLFDAGADINIKDVLDMTAVQYARILGHEKITVIFDNAANP